MISPCGPTIRQGECEHRLTEKQIRILRLLGESSAPYRLTAMIKALELRPATATHSICSLVDKGLILQRTAPDDGRTSLLALTPEGRLIAARLAAPPADRPSPER